MTRPLAALIAAAVVALLPATAAQAAPPTTAYKNCTELQKHYPNGLGHAKAVDKVTGSGKPVTTFRRDTAGFTLAMKHNRGLDRDKDLIACEKK